MNAFLTYGIAGRWASSDAYFQQLTERCEDLREERIAGYAQLTDFIQRRLAHVIRGIERVHVHHRTVGQRVANLLDRIRTELDSLQTQQIVATLGEQQEAGKSLVAASTKLEGAADQIDQNLIQLVNLQKAGDALVLIAGTYYSHSLLDAVLGKSPGQSVTLLDDHARLALAFVIAILLRLFARYIFSALEWVTTTAREGGYWLWRLTLRLWKLGVVMIGGLARKFRS